MRRYLKVTAWLMLIMLSLSGISFAEFIPTVTILDIEQGSSGLATFQYRYTVGPGEVDSLWLGANPSSPFESWIEQLDLGSNVTLGTDFGVQNVTINVPIDAVPQTYTLYVYTSFSNDSLNGYGDYILVGVRVSEKQDIEVEVDIDIKPESDENPVNLKSKGTLPVAIMTTEEFDASEVDPATVTINGIGIEMKKNGRMMYSMEDVDGDGDLDMMMHFSTQALMIDPGASRNRVGMLCYLSIAIGAP